MITFKSSSSNFSSSRYHHHYRHHHHQARFSRIFSFSLYFVCVLLVLFGQLSRCDGGDARSAESNRYFSQKYINHISYAGKQEKNVTSVIGPLYLRRTESLCFFVNKKKKAFKIDLFIQ